MQKFLGYIEQLKIKWRDWFVARAHGPHAQGWLAALSFGEATVIPLAPDVLLIAILLAGASRWFYYASLTTVSSALGGIFGYLVGAFLFETVGKFVVSFYGLESEMLLVAQLFQDNAFWTIFTAAFTPVPYKVFTISAGFFSISFWTFLAASIIGRGARFFAVAYLVKLFGDRFGHFIFKYFNIISILVILWGFVFLLFVKVF